MQFVESLVDNCCPFQSFSNEKLIRQVVFLANIIVRQCNPQSDKHVGASVNCRLGGLAVVLVASRTELMNHGLLVELLRHLLQCPGCIPDCGTGRVRLDSLKGSHPLISDRFSMEQNAQILEVSDELPLRYTVMVDEMSNLGNEIETRI